MDKLPPMVMCYARSRLRMAEQGRTGDESAVQYGQNGLIVSAGRLDQNEVGQTDGSAHRFPSQ